MNQHDLNRLLQGGVLSELDIHFADLLSRLSDRPARGVSLAAALVSNATRQGHICLDLAMMAGRQLLEKDNGEPPVVCPSLDAWINAMRKSPVVGRPGDFAPLIMDERGRVYLYRYWDYQNTLATWIIGRVQSKGHVDTVVLKAGLDRLFPTAFAEQGPDGTETTDWQKIAAFVALAQNFCVISGGPGTGKTTTVAKILALLLEQPDSERLQIALAAPTGKAAARLQEAIKDSKQSLPVASDIKERIPEEASTIHRLLGGIPGSPYFRRDRSNPLPADIVVVDEASMVDLALMAKLVQALPSEGRLILLGDKDQLASVEAGAVLGDMCASDSIHSFSGANGDLVREVTGFEVPTGPDGDVRSGIRDCVVGLQKNFRFGEGSGIGVLSRAINAGDGDAALSLLTTEGQSDFRWKCVQHFPEVLHHIKSRVVHRFGACLRARNVEECFALFDRFRILCAVREGPFGVVSLNEVVKNILSDEGLVAPHARWYAGRPVMINRNDYNLRLFNGDVGIAWPDPETHELRVFFSTPGGGVRKFHPVRLPEHETVFAMTVHKSQGSEFDEVLFIMPDKDYPLLTRELLYTGITRARHRVDLWVKETVVRMAISRCIERMSGLRDALWGG